MYAGSAVQSPVRLVMSRFRNPRRPRIFGRPLVPPQPRPDWQYRPPHFATEYQESINLPLEHHQLKIRRCEYRRMVVDFALVQVFYVDGVPTQIAKIDCCFGKVHTHQYVRSTGQDIFNHDALIVIPQRKSFSVVDEWYDRSLDMMVYGWDENLRRWNDG
jgi:hypothetical protein